MKLWNVQPTQDLGQWHYGLGVWLQCRSAAWDEAACGGENATLVGASGTGFFPWVNRRHGYFGLIVRPTTTNAVARSQAVVMTIVGIDSRVTAFLTRTNLARAHSKNLARAYALYSLCSPFSCPHVLLYPGRVVAAGHSCHDRAHLLLSHLQMLRGCGVHWRTHTPASRLLCCL